MIIKTLGTILRHLNDLMLYFCVVMLQPLQNFPLTLF